MKVLACYTIKGGVGKTASAVNLAYLAAHGGAQTLVWDLDPQGACSYYFRVKAKVKGGGKQVLKKTYDLDQCIKGTDYDRLDLLPADFSYRNMDLFLSEEKNPTRRLAQRLKAFSAEYEYVFLDCPPNITLLSESVIEAVDALLVPVIPTTLSLRTLDQLIAFVEKNSRNKPLILPFFSMVDVRKSLHKEIIESATKKYSQMLKGAIPNASDIERMGLERAVVASYAGRGRAVLAYEALWEEIRLILGDG